MPKANNKAMTPAVADRPIKARICLCKRIAVLSKMSKTK
jgi:hypothetical protein